MLPVRDKVDFWSWRPSF